jgi:hypothetical protein
VIRNALRNNIRDAGEEIVEKVREAVVTVVTEGVEGEE